LNPHTHTPRLQNQLARAGKVFQEHALHCSANPRILDYDIQLYYRRAKQLQLNWWDARTLENLIAAEVLDGPGRTIPDPFKV